MKKIFLIILIFSSSIYSYSQGEYLKYDMNAVMVGYSFTNVDDLFTHSVNIGYTIDRSVDINGSYAFGDDYQGFGAGISVNLLKDKFITISPGLGIVHYSFLNEPTEITINGYFIGLGFSKRINLNDNFALVPTFSISELFIEETDYVKKANLTNISFSLAFVINTNDDLYIGIGPHVIGSEDTAGIGFNLFAIFN